MTLGAHHKIMKLAAFLEVQQEIWKEKKTHLTIFNHQSLSALRPRRALPPEVKSLSPEMRISPIHVEKHRDGYNLRLGCG